MSNKETGGAAFPNPDTNFRIFETGMTLRDYFAAKAMQTVLAADVCSTYNVQCVAEESYAIADAMLAERTK